VDSRDEHGSGLDRTGSGLKPIFAGSGLDRTAILLKIGGSRLDRTEKICFGVIILTASKISVVMRFYRFVKSSVYFAINQWQKFCWDYVAIRTESTFV